MIKNPQTPVNVSSLWITPLHKVYFGIKYSTVYDIFLPQNKRTSSVNVLGIPRGLRFCNLLFAGENYIVNALSSNKIDRE